MREILISFGVVIFCALLLIVSSLFGNSSKQESIASELKLEQSLTEITAKPKESSIALKTNSGEANNKMDLSKAVTTESGLKYIDEKVGDGVQPTSGQTVKVHYTGSLKMGKNLTVHAIAVVLFSFNIGVGQVIQGWDEGVGTMKVGGRRILIIPPELGYGARGAGGVIPPNATLIFDVELLDVK